MRRLAVLIACVLAASAAAPASFADDRSNATPRAFSSEAAEQARKPCACRAQGRAFVAGDQTCLNGLIAVCDMDQNVMTWRMTGQRCPQS